MPRRTPERNAPSPHERLEAAIKDGRAPKGVHPLALRAAIRAWAAWCAAEGRDPEALNRQASAGYLDSLLAAAANPRTAHARFANFQVAAALAWGAETASLTAETLRAARVTSKPAPADRWAQASHSVAALPADIRGAFERLLAVSQAKKRRGSLIWSAARINAVATALRRFRAASKEGQGAVPNAVRFINWANAMAADGAAATSIACYLERVLAAYEKVLTPGMVYDGAGAIVDRWSAKARRKGGVRSVTPRMIPATRINDEGLEMMAEAEAAPIRRIGEAILYRNGLLLCVAACLPERCRALSVLEFDSTLFLEEDGFIRVALPGEALKRRERAKAAPGVSGRFQNARLHRALATWRAKFRPMFDDGEWVFPSQLRRDHPLTGARLAQIFRDVTRARLGVSVSIHDIRGCVVTEWTEADPVKGPAQSSALMRHRDHAVTEKYYLHAEGLVACAAWDAVMARRRKDDRPTLDLEPP